MAAAMSTADGLLLAIANALSHDLYYKIIDPKPKLRPSCGPDTAHVIAHSSIYREYETHGYLGRSCVAFDFAMSGSLPAGTGYLVETSK